MSIKERLNVLDFIISVLEIHEKDLDNKINQLETNIERLGNLLRAIEVLIIQEKTDDIQKQVRKIIVELLETPFSL
jgi:GTPase involved in cell partitioning and DNA repair